MIIIAEAEERVIEGSIAYLRGRKRTERGTFDIVLFWLLFIVMRLRKEVSHHLVQMHPKIFSSNHITFRQELSVTIGS